MNTSPSRPNIIYMHSHDTGRYIQPYGYPVRTPNLQRFAEQGVMFRQAFCANPTCSPSRASLLTGTYPHQNGMLGLAHRGFALHDYKQHIIHTLKPAGYTTALCGQQHIAHHTQQGAQVIGYDQILPVKNNLAEHVAPMACEFLEKHAAAGGQPFFLSVGFFETHRSFPKQPDAQDDPRYVRPPAIFPDNPDTRADFARFATAAHTLDTGMGRVLDALDKTGLADNTLVIITTDHGIAFPDMKCHLTDHGTGVMLMIRSPKPLGFTGGQIVDAMVSHMDIFPTICELLDIEKPERLMGRSMLPLLDGQSAIHDELMMTVNAHAALEPMRAVRTDRYKLIRRYDQRTQPVMPNCDDGPTKTDWLNAGWRQRPLDETMLFDLALDPMERRNLADDPHFADVLADMNRRLEKLMRDSDDPLLGGVEAIPWPQTMMTNHPDADSPHVPTASAAPAAPVK